MFLLPRTHWTLGQQKWILTKQNALPPQTAGLRESRNSVGNWERQGCPTQPGLLRCPMPASNSPSKGASRPGMGRTEFLQLERTPPPFFPLKVSHPASLTECMKPHGPVVQPPFCLAPQFCLGECLGGAVNQSDSISPGTGWARN